MFKDVLTKFVGRVVVALFTLIVLPVLPAIVKFFNDVLSVGLTEHQVLDYANNMSYGVAALAVTWLVNRGWWERLAHTAADLFAEGKDIADADAQESADVEPPVTTPPTIKNG